MKDSEMHWKLWQGGGQETWDSLLLKHSDFTIYQSYAWGEHRAKFGWQPLRLVLQEDNEIKVMAQVLLRRFPLSIGLAWIPGGPIGKIESWGKHFQHAISQVTGLKFVYCRINSMHSYFQDDESMLLEEGWVRSRYTINSGLSLNYFPSNDEGTRMLQCSKNWRHNLRRATKRKIHSYLWENPHPAEMIAAYSKMEEHKQLKQQTSLEQIESIRAAFGSNCILVRCDDEEGNLLAFRGALLLGGKGWDMYAATTPEGRKLYASHSAFWELMTQCSIKKIKWYDMSGVDPIKNPGVANFKKGTGARDLKYLGEWEYSNSIILRRLANHIFRIKLA
jgi:hypothetical protein